MGLPRLPCCPWGGEPRPKSALEAVAWSPGTEPSALEVWGGEWGAPNSAVKVAARSQNIRSLSHLASDTGHCGQHLHIQVDGDSVTNWDFCQ